jgi:hypothetical protein
VNGLGVSALLLARLRPPQMPAGPLRGPLLRLGLMCAAQLALFLAATLAAR